MRILLVTPMPPRAEAPGAIPLVLHAELKGLSARHDVTLLTVVGDEDGEAEAALELQRSRLEVCVVDRRTPHGLARWRRRRRLAATWVRGRYPWRTVWFADPQIQGVLDRLTRDEVFDIVAVEDNSMGIFNLPGRIPAVLTEHEVQRPRAIDWRPGAPRDWPSRAVAEVDSQRWPRYQSGVWRRFDAVQVFSPEERTAIAELAPDVLPRVHVNPFGIDLPEAVDTRREQPGLLLFAGNFTHPPNVDASLWLGREIMPRLRTLCDGARLVVIGKSAPNEVRALAADDVEVLGEVPSISPYLEAAAVVIAPVRTGGGMRMKVLHALASGKAVVTTHRGSDGLMLAGPDPPLVVRDDAVGIASATAELLRDARRRHALGARARTFAAAHHSPEAYAERLESVYERVLGERQSTYVSTAVT
jgi:polysaccharide biosynthesis protein PslH